MNDGEHIFSLTSLFVKSSHFTLKQLLLGEKVPNTFSKIEGNSFSTQQ
jgi:hypothetical protein